MHTKSTRMSGYSMIVCHDIWANLAHFNISTYPTTTTNIILIIVVVFSKEDTWISKSEKPHWRKH